MTFFLRSVVETSLLEPDLFDTYIAFDPSLWWNGEHFVKTAADRLRAVGQRPPETIDASELVSR